MFHCILPSLSTYHTWLWNETELLQECQQLYANIMSVVVYLFNGIFISSKFLAIVLMLHNKCLFELTIMYFSKIKLHQIN